MFNKETKEIKAKGRLKSDKPIIFTVSALKFEIWVTT